MLAFVPRPDYSPHGLVLPAKTVRAPISADQVTIYHQAPPGNLQTLGQIRVEYAFNALNVHTRDVLFAKVKSLAASVGANGVVVTALVPGDNLRKVLTFFGTAIYVPDVRSNPS